VRAVNLISADGGRGGRSGGLGVYALLGALALALVGVLAYVTTHNQVVERRAQLASLQAQTQALQARVDASRPYTEFAALAQARVETVRQLGKARFDWHRAFGDLARVMPGDVWLTSLLGTVTTGVNAGGGGGDTSGVRSALPNPAIELSGCTTGHDEVARLISRLRLMTGVVRVSLSGSAKAGSGSSSGGGGDCTYGHSNFTQFGVVVFFAPLPAVPSPAQPGAAGATTASAPAPAGTTTPAASTIPAPGAASPSGATTPAAPAPTTGDGSAG
jgi:Tfp pilus assembly protein PilN